MVIDSTAIDLLAVTPSDVIQTEILTDGAFATLTANVRNVRLATVKAINTVTMYIWDKDSVDSPREVEMTQIEGEDEYNMTTGAVDISEYDIDTMYVSFVGKLETGKVFWTDRFKVN